MSVHEAILRGVLQCEGRRGGTEMDKKGGGGGGLAESRTNTYTLVYEATEASRSSVEVEALRWCGEMETM